MEPKNANPRPAIIRTTCDRTYRVVAYPNAALDHVWAGIPVKLVRGAWVDRAKARVTMVRRAGCRVVQGAV